MITQNDIQRQFRAELQHRNLEINGDLIADGRWHRCTATNKSGRNDAGSYQLHTEGAVPWGLFQNFTGGHDTDYWRGDPARSLTDTERAQLDQQERQAWIDAERIATEEREKAARKAKRWWSLAQPATADHPYLKEKNVKPHGIKVDDEGRLLVPLYSPEDGEIVSLQLIDRDGAKWFLHGGRVKGCLFVIPGGNRDRLVVGEGFATTATVNETLDCTGAVAFNSGNLAMVASAARKFLNGSESAEDELWRWRTQTAAQQGLRAAEQHHRSSDIALVIAADDDWKNKDNPGIMKALAAGRAAQAKIAVPDFGAERADDDTDFNDMVGLRGRGAVKQAFTDAVEPQALFERRLLAEPTSAFSKANIAELAAWMQHDRPYYENLLGNLKKKISVRDLRTEVKKAIEQEVARAAAARGRQHQVAEVDIEALAVSARQIIDCENVLALFADEFSRRITGERKLAKVLYLASTSRLLDDTMQVALKGVSSGGKSIIRQHVLDFIPPEAVISFTTLSERVLIYTKEDYAHKILSMGEALSQEETSLQDTLLRQLMSEKKLIHWTLVKGEGGNMEAVKIEKNGPVVFIVTTTRGKLHPENETRMLSLEVNDTAEQTKNVINKIAVIKGLNRQPSDTDSRPWQDYQRWLAAGECRVWIPWAETLSALITNTTSVRLRRDFEQMLSAIKTHALLHRAHRKHTASGIVATIRQDYAVVRELVSDLLDETSEIKMRKTIPATLAAVGRLASAEDETGATVRAISRELNLDISSTRRRLYTAADEGFIENLETIKGRRARYRVTEVTHTRTVPDPTLPTVATLKQAWQERINSRALTSESPARLHAPRSTR